MLRLMGGECREGHSGNSSLLESCSEPEFQCHKNLGGFSAWVWVCWLVGWVSLMNWVKKLCFLYESQIVHDIISDNCCVPGAGPWFFHHPQVISWQKQS